MSSRFKLTSMELGALSVLTLAIAGVAVTISLKSCSDNQRQEQYAVSDSIIKEINRQLATPDSLTQASKPKAKKAKKAKKPKAQRRQPKERNYLDEPVNE